MRYYCWILGATLLAASTLGAAEKSDPQDPELQKKIDEAIRKAYEKAREKARKAEIENCLRKLADHSDNANQYVYMVHLHSMKLSPSEGLPTFIRLLSNESDVVKQSALAGLAEYGPKARAAIPTIVKLLDDSERKWFVTSEAALALAKIAGPSRKAADALLGKLRKPNLPDDVRVKLIMALGMIGPEAKDSIGLLKELLVKDQISSKIQFEAYCAAGAISGGKRLSLADLRRLSKVAWEKPEEGYPVFQAVQREGRRAAFLVPSLLELLQKKSPPHLQAVAIQSIGFVGGGGNKDVVRPLLDGMASAEPFLARVSAEATDRLDTSLAPAFDLFADALTHSNPSVRRHAVLALHRFGPAASKASGQLVEALRRADGTTDLFEIGAYLDALKAVRRPDAPDSSAAAEKLVALLDKRRKLYEGRREFDVRHLRAYVLAVIAELGTPNSALPYILDELNKDDASTDAYGFTAAALAAGSLGAEAKPAVKPLLRAFRPDFRDDDVSFEQFHRNTFRHTGTPTARLEVLRALRKIGPAAREALPLLKTLAADATKLQMRGQEKYLLALQQEAREAIKALEGR